MVVVVGGVEDGADTQPKVVQHNLVAVSQLARAVQLAVADLERLSFGGDQDEVLHWAIGRCGERTFSCAGGELGRASGVQLGLGLLQQVAKRREEGRRRGTGGGVPLELAEDPYPLFLDSVEPNPVRVWLADASSVRGRLGRKRNGTRADGERARSGAGAAVRPLPCARPRQQPSCYVCSEK